MVSSIRLQGYRSYKDEAFEFQSGVNIVVGPNACGKTNLLEAILVACRGSSYRAKDIDLINFKSDWARIDVQEDEHTRVVKLQKNSLPIKTFDLDGKLYKRLMASSKVPVVLFEPNHLQLLGGSPESRRTYLDDFIDQLVPGYGAQQRNYARVLAQRNALLKQATRASSEQFFPWNLRLSQLAGQIVSRRDELINKLNKTLPKIYAELSNSKTKLTLEHKSQLPVANYESAHLEALERSLSDDLHTGFTSYGPHRDDFIVLYNKKAAPLVASRGELRTGVLALKIAELELIEAELSRTPVFLLDDVFSELDGYRRRALTDRLSDGQSFITTTDADMVLKHLSGEYNIVPLTVEE